MAEALKPGAEADVGLRIDAEEARWLAQAARLGSEDTLFPEAAEQLKDLSLRLEQAAAAMEALQK